MEGGRGGGGQGRGAVRSAASDAAAKSPRAQSCPRAGEGLCVAHPLLCLTPDTRPVSDLVTHRAGGPQPEAGGVRRGGYLGGMVSMFPRQREPRGQDTGRGLDAGL